MDYFPCFCLFVCFSFHYTSFTPADFLLELPFLFPIRRCSFSSCPQQLTLAWYIYLNYISQLWKRSQHHFPRQDIKDHCTISSLLLCVLAKSIIESFRKAEHMFLYSWFGHKRNLWLRWNEDIYLPYLSVLVHTAPTIFCLRKFPTTSKDRNLWEASVADLLRLSSASPKHFMHLH